MSHSLLVFDTSTSYRFQQDGAKPHTARATIDWIRSQSIKQFNGGNWPANSPDMNPIEHVWPIVGRKLVGQVFANRDALWSALVDAFGSVSPEKIRALYDSMPSRIESLLAAKGGHTRY